MPSVVGLLEEWERAALVRAEGLRVELDGPQAELARTEDAARRAVIAREELVEVLSGPAGGQVAAGEPSGAAVVVPAAGAGARPEVVGRREDLEASSVLPQDYAGVVSLVLTDAAVGGDGLRARGLRDGLGLGPADTREQAARFRAKRLVERGWLTEVKPGLFRLRPGWSV
jgi:hypothetical protein